MSLKNNKVRDTQLVPKGVFTPISFGAVVLKCFLPKDPFVWSTSDSDVGQNKWTEIAKKGWSRITYNRTLERFISGVKANEPTAGF